jgi:nicotinate-nucleotide--dimethylbenzimidazole phosphoribosyltransferase
VGRGAGLDDKQLKRKIAVCQQALAYHNKGRWDPLDLLSTFGGFEIAMICGAMLQAAQHTMIVLVDGFIASAAYLVAYSMNSNIKDYAIFCHQSEEAGHAGMLDFLDAQPSLKLNMRLGEGTGVAVAYPLVQSAVNFLNEMASFASAGVSGKK